MLSHAKPSFVSVLNMIAIYKFFIWIFVWEFSMGSSIEFFNLTLTMPNIDKNMSNQSVFIGMEFPIDEELYIVNFQPIYNRKKVQFITTYLCSRPYSKTDQFWFGYQPCSNMERSMIIYEWYYNIPAVQWPTNAGFRVGTNTPYRYVIIHIQYFSSVINDIYGQQITFSRQRLKYRIGTYPITTNTRDFSCRYHSALMQIFSTRFYSNYEGDSISLYRVRNNQLQPIIQGNLQWPQTFYQLENPIDIQMNDYLIGTCIYDDQTEYFNGDAICQIIIMFTVNQEDEMPKERCRNNNYPRIVELFLPIDVDTPPETLFDINPTYPKLSPNEWAKINEDSLLSTSKSMNDTTYVNDDHSQNIIHFAQTHQLIFVLSICGLAAVLGFLILFIIIILSRKKKKYLSKDNNRKKWITIGGDNSSLSEWLTKRRFLQYDQDDNNNDEKETLTQQQRRASTSEESDLTDDDVFHSSDVQNVVH